MPYDPARAQRECVANTLSPRMLASETQQSAHSEVLSGELQYSACKTMVNTNTGTGVEAGDAAHLQPSEEETCCAMLRPV